jgi:hypothetical protein
MFVASPATCSNCGGKLTFQIRKAVTVYIQAETKLRSRPEAGKQKELKTSAIATIIFVMGLILASESGQKINVSLLFPLESFEAFVKWHNKIDHGFSKSGRLTLLLT